VVVEAMREVGIDISNNKTKVVFDFIEAGISTVKEPGKIKPPSAMNSLKSNRAERLFRGKWRFLYSVWFCFTREGIIFLSR
jgi:hypothetical protein